MNITYWMDDRIQSKTLDSVDEFGNIYYYYWNDVNNRVNIEIREEADQQGFLAYFSINIDDPEKIGYKYADYSDPTNPIIWND